MSGAEQTPEAQRLSTEDQRRRLHIEQTPLAVIDWDLEFRVVAWTPAAERIFGYAAAEAMGRHAGELLIPDEARPHVDAIWQALLKQSGGVRSTNANVTKDGRTIQCEWYNTPLVDEGGETVGVASLVMDVTERHRLELRVQHAQKLESLGVLAGGIAHDFNNLLVAIIGNADLSLEQVDADSATHASLRKIMAAAKRAAELTNQMLAYAGRGQFHIEATDLNRVVREMRKILQVSISKKITLHEDYAADLPSVRADVSQLRQVVMNLITNASDAIGAKSGMVTLRTGLVDANAGYLSHSLLPAEPGYFVFLEVADTGCGMDEATRQKLFDPFFTTKFTGRGLGMSAVLGIVRGHQGALMLYTEPAGGTTFRVLLPVDPDARHALEERAPREHEGSAKRRGTILLADDEELVRRTAKVMLESLGFEVVTANDGREALALYAATRPRVDLVMLDLTMPKMDGAEAFRALREQDPDVCIVLMSGYTELDVEQRLEVSGPCAFVQKPFDRAALREAIDQALACG